VSELRFGRRGLSYHRREEIHDAEVFFVVCLLLRFQTLESQTTFQETLDLYDETSKSLETTHKSAYMYEIPNVGTSNMPKGLGLLLKSRTMYETRDLSTETGRVYFPNSRGQGGEPIRLSTELE
jgi:hypothetical protein